MRRIYRLIGMNQGYQREKGHKRRYLTRLTLLSYSRSNFLHLASLVCVVCQETLMINHFDSTRL
jgi:hypothetical protein